MILWVDTDAAFLVHPGAKSQVAGHYMLSDHPNNLPNSTPPTLTAPVHMICKLIPHVVTSAAEAETGGLFINAQELIPVRHALEALGHPQPPTPLKTDNSTAESFVSKNIKQKKSKTWDMRWNWLRDPKITKLVKIYWDKACKNHADYQTKHHPPSYHKAIRSNYILTGHNVTESKNSAENLNARVCLSSRYTNICRPVHLVPEQFSNDRYIGQQKNNSEIDYKSH